MLQSPKAIFLVLIVTAALYYPGLTGIFLLDDKGNLPPAGSITSVTDIKGITSYTLSGISGPSGRPISLLSFALQGGDVANGAFSFKLFNLIIHLFNGLLIYLITIQITRALPTSGKNTGSTLALFVSAVWLVHPLQVSTVLYVVQRMTELSATFTLLGILAYLHGRVVIPQAQWKKALFIQSAGITGGLLFGILSKENAILLCLYIIVLEATVLQHIERPRLWRQGIAALLVFPLITLALYISPPIIEHLNTPYPIRTYSALERLLTEHRIIVDYLKSIMLPRPNHFGLFHSDYVPSKGLLSPITTLFSILIVVLSTVIAIKLRKKQPLISMGILWFLAGHSLESTVLDLELYFEHRNYLPIYGPIIAVAAALFVIIKKLQTKNFKYGIYAGYVGISVWTLFIIVVLHNETKLWGNPILQAAVWAENHPNSQRAQGHYASLLTQMGLVEEAKERYKLNTYKIPRDPAFPLLWLELLCIKPDLEPPPMDLVLNRLQHGNFQYAVIVTLDEILSLKKEGKCGEISIGTIKNMTHATLENPNYEHDKGRKNTLILAAKAHRLSKEYKEAIAYYNKAFQLKPSPDILLSAADVHAVAGNYSWYIETINYINQYCEDNYTKCLPYSKEIDNHNQNLQQLTDTTL